MFYASTLLSLLSKPAYSRDCFIGQDLSTANTAEQRVLRPWVVVMGHRPIYTVRNAGPDGRPSNVDDGPLKGENGVSVHMKVR